MVPSYILFREDILDDSKDGSRGDRFVKWINRRNVRRRQAKHDVRQTTERVLSLNPKNERKSVSPRNRDKNRSSFLHPLTHQASAQWECLSDAGEMELCAMNSTVVEEDDSSRIMDTSNQVASLVTLDEHVLSESYSWDGSSPPIS